MQSQYQETGRISELEKRGIDALASLSGKNGFWGLAPLMRELDKFNEFENVKELELACYALGLPEGSGILDTVNTPSERVFWSYQEKGIKLPNETHEDLYRIGVYDVHGVGEVWEWGRNANHVRILGRTDLEGNENTVTEAIISKGEFILKQHDATGKIISKPQKINTFSRRYGSIAMVVNGLPEKFSAISDLIDNMKKTEKLPHAPIADASRSLIEALFDDSHQGVHGGAFVPEGATYVEIMPYEPLGEPDVVEIAGAYYRLPDAGKLGLLPIVISGTGTIHRASRADIRLAGLKSVPGLRQNIEIALTIDDRAQVFVDRVAPTKNSFNTSVMPAGVLPSVSDAFANRLKLFNDILWEAQPVELVGTSR